VNVPMNERFPVYRTGQAGHYVVAAAIILAAVLLILFLPRDNGCCCCCQKPASTSSATAWQQLPVHIPPGAGSDAERVFAAFPAIPFDRAATAVATADPVAFLPADEPVAFVASVPVYVPTLDWPRGGAALTPPVIRPLPADVAEPGSPGVFFALGAAGVIALRVARA